MKTRTIAAYEQFLVPRQYSQGPGTKHPSTPLGFLLNLAVRVTGTRVTSGNAQEEWLELVALATDLVAILNVDPYNRYTLVNLAPARVSQILREVGLFDHLFALRQWPPSLNTLVIEAFFRPCSKEIFAKHGFDVDDMIQFVTTVTKLSTSDPSRLTLSALRAGEPGRFEKMWRFVAHACGEVNREYRSPLDATAATLMSKPLLTDYGNTFIALPSPLLGPACYEAFATAAREALTKPQQDKLAGDGTERVVAAILKRRGITPAISAAKYNHGAAEDAGECDFVLETESHIVFVETKAKAPTRATMSGAIHAAVFDFALSAVTAQTQALQHERLLHRDGVIQFNDGRRLELRGRRTFRVSATLLDHGALHDREVFLNVVAPLVHAAPTLRAPNGMPKPTNELREALDEFREEWTAALRRNSDVGLRTGLAAVALSVGQLDAVLGQVDGVDGLASLWRIPAGYGTLNPLLEAFHLRKLAETAATL